MKIPVIANGDIKDFDSAKKSLELSKANGVMIGRGVYGKPWLIAQISSELKGETPMATPTISEQKKIVLNHFNEMLDCYGEQVAILQAELKQQDTYFSNQEKVYLD